MAHSSWGPGWPHCQSEKMVTAKGGGISVTVRSEIKALVECLLAETVRRGYKLDKAHDDWGYACRPITGSTTVPSNHSWGLAVDLNASRNPYVHGAIVTDMPRWLPSLWGRYGFSWGGDYTSVKDAMHYEFLGSMQDCKKMTRKARKELA